MKIRNGIAATAVLGAALMGAIVPTDSASAISVTDRHYCNRHHNTMASEHRETIHVFVDTAPDPVQASGSVYHQVGYWLCRVPGGNTYEQPRWIGVCYTHTGALPSTVLAGIKTDYIGAVSTHRAHEVNDLFVHTNPPIHRGERFCNQAWFQSRKWFRRDELYRWRANYWEVTQGQPDQHHETPAIFLDPNNDRMLTPFRQVAN